MAKRPQEFLADQPALAPARPASIEALRGLALDARITAACEGATAVVPGTGNPAARIVLVGEAPGEQEDREGLPFVGRSGALLERALAEAGLRREDLWITNAVKCRPVQAGRNRAPTTREVKAWLPVLEAELALLRPRAVVALGAVAAKALAGSAFKITRQRGLWLPDPRWGGGLVASWHPAFILRQRGPDRETRFRELATDLSTAAQHR
jgi:DNA polymerase